MDGNFPVVICSSVIRSTKKGESHGGMYLVDLQAEKWKQVADWDDEAIDWEGRGGDRGLRGIAFHEHFIISAASDEIYFYDQDFKIVKSFRNSYLRNCHEIFIHNNLLYLTSTGFDSILVFDLATEQFTKGYCYRKKQVFHSKNRWIRRILKVLKVWNLSFSNDFYTYDPNERGGPVFKDSHHINNVFVDDDYIYFSGTGMDKCMRIDTEDKLTPFNSIPMGTHNVGLYNGKLVYNQTKNDKLVLHNSDSTKLEFDVPTYDLSELKNSSFLDTARQGFGRGLCYHNDYLIGGSSPSTITIYSTTDGKKVKSINIGMDVRNAIHGLEVYPYDLDIDKLSK